MQCTFVCVYVYCVKFHLTFNIIANIENIVMWRYCLRPCEQKSTIIYSASWHRFAAKPGCLFISSLTRLTYACIHRVEELHEVNKENNDAMEG